MKLRAITILMSANALAISVFPVQVKAETPEQLTSLAVDAAIHLNQIPKRPAQITPIRQQVFVQVQKALISEQPIQPRTVEQQDGHTLAIMSALNLSSAQKAQLQQAESVTPEQLESILTPGQRQMWLQMRRAESGR